ncbi:MAG: hypothetical protein HOM55_06235 [Proteobacteria bacterium]|jgi:ribosome-associated heat shock protein Hsp15|nr:hypothetical protein [Pseudomonadota bacterium]
MQPSEDAVRLDKWLWAARFYKTRRLAVVAITSGKVSVNDERPKPARTIKTNDLLLIKQGPHQLAVRILGLADKRGPAKVAQTLYEETADSIARGKKLSLQLKTAAQQVAFDRKKPDQRNRDLSRKSKRGE